MPLNVINCEVPTIECFYNNFINEVPGGTNLNCLAEAQCKRDKAVVWGKIVKVLSFSSENKQYTLLIKEILPNFEYGEKFKALIKGDLAIELARCSPHTGDRVAFFEPLVFLNPANKTEKCTEIKKQPKYLLCCEAASMWFSKKQEMGGKSDDDKGMKQKKSLEKGLEHNGSSTSRKRQYEALPGGSLCGQVTDPSYGKSKKLSTDVGPNSSEISRQKPLIQLPQKPQIPVNAKPNNPHYKYTTIKSINKSDYTCLEQSVNFFAVVNTILKPISCTKNLKHTLICMLMDDSDGYEGIIKFHFFTPEDTILKQIEEGDVLRLHRVKLEVFEDKIDGRIFSSHQIVLFKKNCLDNKPITIAKSTIITGDEIKRVESLKTWYSELLKRPTLLKDIHEVGTYCIICKVVKCEPIREKKVVTVTVTDGTDIKSLYPAIPLVRYKSKDEKKDHIVTVITSHVKFDEYAALKVDDFVLFNEVDAVKPDSEGRLRLEIKKDVSPELVDKTNVADIEWRIEQYLKSVNKVTDPKEEHHLNANEQDNEASVQTRLQKSKQKTSLVKIPENFIISFCDDESDPKPISGKLSSKDDSDTRNTESDQGIKSRKQLFTPNYKTDLSDAATDETSENNLDALKSISNKLPVEEVVNPANTNLNEIIEKLETKYGSKKQQSQTGSPQHEECSSQPSSTRKTRKATKEPRVMLERLSDKKFCEKRTTQALELEDDIEDVETVINNSYHYATWNRSKEGNKRPRFLESLSTEEDKPSNNDTEVDQELGIRGTKVANWLFHPNNRITTTSKEDVFINEFDLPVVKQLLCGGEDPPEVSIYTSSPCYRTHAFLLGVNPEPSTKPFDLVSGYCQSGCKRVFLYSTIKLHIEENSCIPLCPECSSLEQQFTLELMLMMELHIMDQNGRHGIVLALKDHAEQFLNCSVKEYMQDKVVRESRVRLLTDYSMQNTYNACNTPLLDMAICSIKNIPQTYVLVDSTLKLPRL